MSLDVNEGCFVHWTNTRRIGEIDFIGPRPLIDKGDDHITIEMRKQNGSIKLVPGISGYAQINGRIDISPEEKALLDGFYYEHISLWLDIRIFIITILQTLHLRKNRPKSEQEGKYKPFFL